MADNTFDAWLREYGRTWMEKDVPAFTKLFSEDAYYHWTPYEEPKVGREAIGKAVEDAITTQRDITFHYAILSASGFPAVAHWRTTYVRTTTEKEVTLDGIMSVEFDENGLCRVFREWWHSTDPLPE